MNNYGGGQYGGGQYGGGNYGGGAAKPDNNLVWAILTTLFCCLPFGIVSIVHAAKVDSLWNQGDHAGSMDASQKAKKWAIISAVSGLVIGVLYVLFVIVLGVAGSSSTGY